MEIVGATGAWVGTEPEDSGLGVANQVQGAMRANGFIYFLGASGTFGQDMNEDEGLEILERLAAD